MQYHTRSSDPSLSTPGGVEQNISTAYDWRPGLLPGRPLLEHSICGLDDNRNSLYTAPMDNFDVPRCACEGPCDCAGPVEVSRAFKRDFPNPRDMTAEAIYVELERNPEYEEWLRIHGYFDHPTVAHALQEVEDDDINF